MIAVLTGCSGSTKDKFEACADGMFIFTNELLKEKAPQEATSRATIEEFNLQPYSDKRKHKFYDMFVQICEVDYKRFPDKFDAKWE